MKSVRNLMNRLTRLESLPAPAAPPSPYDPPAELNLRPEEREKWDCIVFAHLRCHEAVFEVCCNVASDINPNRSQVRCPNTFSDPYVRQFILLFIAELTSLDDAKISAWEALGVIRDPLHIVCYCAAGALLTIARQGIPADDTLVQLLEEALCGAEPDNRPLTLIRWTGGPAQLFYERCRQ